MICSVHDQVTEARLHIVEQGCISFENNLSQTQHIIQGVLFNWPPAKNRYHYQFSSSMCEKCGSRICSISVFPKLKRKQLLKDFQEHCCDKERYKIFTDKIFNFEESLIRSQ